VLCVSPSTSFPTRANDTRALAHARAVSLSNGRRVYDLTAVEVFFCRKVNLKTACCDLPRRVADPLGSVRYQRWRARSPA